jgi:2-iminobutanoate/2-iminopropanoate deaminase
VGKCRGVCLNWIEVPQTSPFALAGAFTTGEYTWYTKETEASLISLCWSAHGRKEAQVGGNDSAAREPIKRLRVPELPLPVGPYTDIAVANGTAWISGIVAMDSEGRVVHADDPEAQVRYVLERLADALKVIRSSPSDIIHLTNYVTDASLRTIVHRLREEVLPDSAPASTMVVVAGLVAEGLLYEVQAVAVAS